MMPRRLRGALVESCAFSLSVVCSSRVWLSELCRLCQKCDRILFLHSVHPVLQSVLGALVLLISPRRWLRQYSERRFAHFRTLQCLWRCSLDIALLVRERSK